MKKSLILIILIVIALLGFSYIVWEKPFFTFTAPVKSIDRSKVSETKNYLGKVTAKGDTRLTGKVEFVSPDKKTIFLKTGSIFNNIPIIVKISFDNQTIYWFLDCSSNPCESKPVSAQKWWQNFAADKTRDKQVWLICRDSNCQKIISIN